MTESDYQIFTIYSESAKAATAFYIDNFDETSRGLFSKVWKKYAKKVVNFAISVGGGAVLGAAIGYLSTENIAGVVAGGVATATYCGVQSLKTGNIVIGIEIKL